MSIAPDRILLAAAPALGALATLGFAPLDLPAATLIALASLFVLWEHVPARRAAQLGWLFGLGWFGVGVSWVYVSMHDYGAMPAPLAAAATLLFAAYLSLYPALAGALAGRLRTRHWTHLYFVLPAAWTLSEWLRGWVFTGFPWLATGYAQTDGVFRGHAPLLGVYGLCFLSAFAAGVAVDWWHRLGTAGQGRPRARDLIWLGVLGVSVLLPGVEWTAPQGEPVKVALLQGNIAQDLKFEAGRFEATLAQYRRLIESAPAQIVVLPETALPRMLGAIPADYLAWLERFASAGKAAIVAGVPLAESPTRYFNSAVSFGAGERQRYDKAHLVPFGEFIPFGFRWFVDAMQMPLGDFTRGSEKPVPLALGEQRVAVNICYEDLFGEEIIRQLPQATLLVNISNIAWFGDSLAPHQHLQISRMRALETGRPMLRATNTGATAVIDAGGRVTHQLRPFTEGTLVAEVRGYAGSTPYVRTGNAPVIGACLLLLGFAGWRARARPGPARA